MKKKLLYFSHGLSANGIESFLVNVLKIIDKEKYDITVLIAIDEGVPSLHEPTVLDYGVKVVHAGDLDTISKKIQYYKNVKKFLSENQFDIVHSHMDLLNGITLRLAKKYGIKKRICHAHNSKSQYKPVGALAKIKMIVQKMYYRIMKKSMMKSSTDLLACSDLAGEYFFDGKPFELIYNGVDLDRFKMSDDFDGNEYSKTFGFNGDEKHKIVTVGRVSDQKNPLFAIDVISELKKIRNDFKYVWVGVGGLEDAVNDKIKSLALEDTVIMAGLHTDIPQILNCCDCFLMTSIFEGLPFTLVEAQAAGLSCVVSDVVTKNADAGLLEYISLEKSAKEWAEFVSSVLDKPLAQADERLELFDIKNTVRQLEEIYDR